MFRGMTVAATLAVSVGALAACGRVGFDPIGSGGGDASSVDGATSSADANANDVDGDGVPNASDNCPMVSNSTQADEDGDMIGDACDPCPPFSDLPVTVDLDNDGVSDACDPSPSTPGDHIVAFEGFSDQLPQGWATEGACQWTVSGGVASVVSADGLDCWLVTPRPEEGGSTVTSPVAVDQLFGTSYRNIGVVDEFEPSTPQGVGCTLLKDTQGDNELEILDGSGGPLSSSPVATIQAGTMTTMEITRTGTTYRCSGSGQTTMASSSFTATAPQAGVRTRSTSAHFEWVLVVSHTP